MLDFGPEWMRVLTGPGNNNSPGHPNPPIQLKPKPAAAEHCYSREKMLELCIHMETPPETLHNDPAAICGDPEYTVPLAYTAQTQDEQRMWQRNINSESAVRLLNTANGRGGGNNVGPGSLSGNGGGGGGGGGASLPLAGMSSRGRINSMDRGRGRARGGPSSQYYMRGLSYDEDMDTNRGGLAPPGITMRRGVGVGPGNYERSSSLSGGLGGLSSSGDGRSNLGAWGVPPNIAADHPSQQMTGYHASQSMEHSVSNRGSITGEDRGGASSPRKEQGRASTENWRSRDMSGSIVGPADPGSQQGAQTLQDHWRAGAGAGLAANPGPAQPRQQQEKWGSNRGSNSNNSSGGGWRPRDSMDDGGYSTYSYGGARGRGGLGGHQRTRQPWDNNTRRNWPDDSSLPEWATDLCQEAPRNGSFDASGAFHAPTWGGGNNEDDYVSSSSGSNGGGGFLSMVGGRARQKSGSLGPDNITSTTTTSAVAAAVTSNGLVSESATTTTMANMAPPPPPERDTLNDHRNDRQENDGDAASSGEQQQQQHNTTIGRRRQQEISDATSTNRALESQKRLSEALEQHGQNINAMVNGYGDRDTSSSGDNSHEGSNSPLMENRGSNMSSNMPGSGSGTVSVAGIVREVTSQHHMLSSHASTGRFSQANTLQRSNSMVVHSHSNGPPRVGSVPSTSSHALDSSNIPNSLSNSIANSIGNSMNTLRRELSSHDQFTSSVAESKDDGDKYREEDLEHMQSVADDLVSKLVDEDPRSNHHDQLQQMQQSAVSLQSSLLNPPPPAGFLPLTDQTMDTNQARWFYTDPQQKVQGPFSSVTMTSWYNSGYFTDGLLLRRECDDKFAMLGDLKRVFGRVPFLPGPPVPPLKLPKMRESQDAQEVAEKERLQKQQTAEKEAYERAVHSYDQQRSIFEQQQLFRRSQILTQLTGMEKWSSLSTAAQQQLYLRHVVALPALSEPVMPTPPAFLLVSNTSNNTTSSNSSLSMPNMLNIPPNLQPQSTSPGIPEHQQQLQKSSSVSALSTSNLLPHNLSAGNSSTGINDVVLQHLQKQQLQQSRLAPPNTTGASSSLSNQLGGQQQQQQASHSRDPIQDLVAQMSSVSTSSVTGGLPLSSSSLSLHDSSNVSSLLQHSGKSSSSLSTLASDNTLPSENPLSKFLMQLQNNSSNTSNNNNVSSSTSSGMQPCMSVPPSAFSASPLTQQQQQSSVAISAASVAMPPATASAPVATSSLLQQHSSPSSTLTSTTTPHHTLSNAGGGATMPATQHPQEDVIHSFMQHLSKMQHHKVQHQQPPQQQMQAVPSEEENKLLQQQQTRKVEDERRKADALRHKKEQDEMVARKKMEEEHKKKEEQKKKEHEEELKKKIADAKRKEEEKKSKHKLKQQEEANRRQEEKRRQEEENRIKKAEEKRREQEAREAAEQQRKQQEELRRLALEEERKRMHQIEQEEKQAALLQQQLDAARLQQQQQQQAAWGAAAVIPVADRNSCGTTPSLIEIQKIQQEKERVERERWLKDEEARKQEVVREATEKKKAASVTLKWAVKQGSAPGGSSVKSLLQIQAEEEKEMKKRLTREQQESKAAAAAAAAATASTSPTGPASHSSSSSTGRGWGAASQLVSWASRASSAAPPAPTHQQQSKNWNEGNYPWSSAQQQQQQVSGGFWESGSSDGKAAGKTAASVAASRTPTKPVAAKAQQSNKAPATGKVVAATAKQTISNKLNTQLNHNNNNNNNKTAAKKKGKEEEVKKIINESAGSVDQFNKWCNTSIVALKVNSPIDVPTFVNFLRDVESPYEVHDYIRSYLGDTREVKEFAKNYLDRRSQVLNATRQKNVAHDDILAPAPAINPASETFQEAKNRKQKGKKKMQKVDSSILGFNVNAKERLNGDENSGQQ